MNTLRFLLSLTVTNLKATFALRGAFWLQASFMLVNNLIFFTVWLIFFNRFDEVRGWRLPDMGVLYGVAASGYGLSVIFAAGVRDLARMIVDGDLDPYLTQPKPVLMHAVGSRSSAAGWGDILSGVVLIGFSGLVTWQTLPWVLLAPVLGAFAITATAILVCSLAFWLGPMDQMARQVIEFTVLCAVYPTSIFGGFLRVVLFTVIPAGFMSHLPVELIRAWSPRAMLFATGGVALFTTLAVVVFHQGLKRYTSGNRFGVRA
ncbi:MAG: ABC-2 family transporter protein [Planctomycetota bacterium]|nr:ABC-2 family transporter protein [Planctomycetota bacterium]